MRLPVSRRGSAPRSGRWSSGSRSDPANAPARDDRGDSRAGGRLRRVLRAARLRARGAARVARRPRHLGRARRHAGAPDAGGRSARPAERPPRAARERLRGDCRRPARGGLRARGAQGALERGALVRAQSRRPSCRADGRLAGAPLMRAAVVGHVEWVEFAPVRRVPRQGEIAHVASTFEAPAGGGAVAAVQLARLADECIFYTALGDDELGRRTIEGLEQLGVRVEAAIRPGKPTRRGFTYLDDDGERTITVIGERLGPSGADEQLPWDELADVDGVYFVAGDVEALRRARAARALVATSRITDFLETAGVQLDAVVGSGADVSERYRPIEPAPRYVAVTAGARGGKWTGGDGRTGAWHAAELPGPVADAYGCGDSFAAGLAYGLGDGRDIDAALALAARCGATCMTGPGPYTRQLTRAEL